MSYEALIGSTASMTHNPRAMVRRVLEAFLSQVRGEVWHSGRVVIPGFLIAKVKQRKPRLIANPNTGEPISLPAFESVSLRATGNWRAK